MAKKSKKSISETMVKSILEDLQNDDSSYKKKKASAFGQAILDGNPNPTKVEAQTRLLPEGLGDEMAAYGDTNFGESENQTVPHGLLVDSNDPILKRPESHSLKSASPMSAPLQKKTSYDDATEISLNPEESSGSDQDATLNMDSKPSEPDRTQVLSELTDRTQAMTHPVFVSAVSSNESATKISHGLLRQSGKSSHSYGGSSIDAQLMQSETLKLAQARILELEKELERLRSENELLGSAGEIAKSRAEDLAGHVTQLERNKYEDLNQARMEMNIYRESLVEKEKELGKAKQKITELDSRLAKDLKKIRVRERELENRLELSKMEKNALVRAKDDAILDLKNRLDQMNSDLESYKNKCAELNNKVENQGDHLSRTVRALRLALTHLEAADASGSSGVVPFKKAE